MYKDFSALNDFNLNIKNGKIYAERLSTSLYGNQLYQTAFSSDFSLNDNVLKLENIDSLKARHMLAVLRELKKR